MLGTENLGEQALNKIAQLALSSQLKDADSLEVQVKTAPEKAKSAGAQSPVT